jgi:cellulose synthase (UDP-forming)
MATETATEDMLTSFRMEEHGFRTIFLNEPLSLGLAPEDLKEYVTQRSRWCLGAIHQTYTGWSFLGNACLRPISRLSFFDAALCWSTNSVFKLMVLIGPLVYCPTGTVVIRAQTPDLLYALAPMMCCNLMFISFFGRNLVLPIITDVAHLLSSFVIVRTVAQGLQKPRGHAFKVTAKGVSSNTVTVQWRMFLSFALLGQKHAFLPDWIFMESIDGIVVWHISI